MQPALVSAVRALLADGGTRPTHPSPLAIAPDGTVAVLRSVNRDGRATQELLREVTAHAGVSLLDITPAPAFGAIPHMRRVSLVVATTPTLAVAAECCAAAWRAPVILPDAVTRPSGPAHLLMRPEPTLTLELDNGRTDAVVQSLHITDALRRAMSSRIVGRRIPGAADHERNADVCPE